MKYVYPDYYPEFRCLAGECRHSCCIGWEIDIDPNTMERYRTEGGAFGDRLRDAIDENGEVPCFTLQEGERCPFLNNRNLCDIYIHLGEEALCQICTDHPRYRNFFSDRVETGLGLCCEAAGALILGRQETVQWIEMDDGAGEAVPDEEEQWLRKQRHTLLNLLQDRSKPMHIRLAAAEEYSGGKTLERTPAQWAVIYRDMERLDPAWDGVLDALAEIRDMTWTPEPALETVGEQLAIYFLYRHLADSLDDGRFGPRVRFAVHAARLLMTLMQRTSMSGGCFSLSKAVELARLYSAEIEYDEENINTLLEQL